MRRLAILAGPARVTLARETARALAMRVLGLVTAGGWPLATRGRRALLVRRGAMQRGARRCCGRAGAVDRLDPHAAIILADGARTRRHRCRESCRDRAGDLESGLVGLDADRADRVLGDSAAAADQRQDPARIGILAAADIHAEPH